MPKKSSAKSGSELFIVDNSDDEWKALRYLRDWCAISQRVDVASGYFEVGSLLALDGHWQRVDGLRVLMGDEVAARTREAFRRAVQLRVERLDQSIEAEKEKDDFHEGLPAVLAAIASGQIEFRVYRKEKFHAKAYITHARMEVVGSTALVGSSNFTLPGLTRNVELNVQITGGPVTVLQEWYDAHWELAEDVTPEILRTIERHVQVFTPFEVYAQSLREYFKRREITAGEWEKHASRIWPLLDGYQKEGYGQLLKIAGDHGGAFLCDGVGLGKTFVGLMLLERLLWEGRKVVLIVPKSGRKAVWEAELKRHLPKLKWSGWSNLRLLNHTDLSSSSRREEIEEITAQQNAAIIIDEAHNFRNPGLKGEGEKRESRYRVLQRMAQGKQLFMLTATPVNNGVMDLMHLIELFAGRADRFSNLGVHSLQGHFRTLERTIRRANAVSDDALPEADVDQTVEVGPARAAFAADPLVNGLVVQRSRAYVKASQFTESKGAAIFPLREPPKVADYDLSAVQKRLLDLVVEAFDKGRPLLKLAVYDVDEWLKDPSGLDDFERGRREQVVQLIRIGLIKRLESSTSAFELSCHRLFRKLLAFWRAQAGDGEAQARLRRWEARHGRVIDQVRAGLAAVEPGLVSADDEGPSADDADPLIDDEDVEILDADLYKLDELLEETALDLEQLAKFIESLRDFTPNQDGKLNALLDLMRSDPVLSAHKVLIFTEYQATARHLSRELTRAGLQGVAQVDSTTVTPREQVIGAFAPYYNRSSSAELAAAGRAEIRVLIATDVLSEGLNLQDATRLINYDLHWNPVRLMQRIGRVDRRMNPEIEARLVTDHPDAAPLRGHVAYWNFLPTKVLDLYLNLYGRLDRKARGISRLLGIEGRQLLTPEDDYEELRVLNEQLDGSLSEEEALRQELRELLIAHPDLDARLDGLPNRVFSVRGGAETTAGVFLCYALPGRTVDQDGTERWDDDAARVVRWYFRDAATGTVLETPFAAKAIAERVRCDPDMPRSEPGDRPALLAARAAVEKQITSGYLRSAQAPADAKPILKAWMELT